MTIKEILDPLPDNLMRKIKNLSGCDVIRDIPGFVGYAITIDGQVWSAKKRGRNPTAKFDNYPRKMKQHMAKGYPVVNLSNGLESVTLTVIRIWALAFISLPPADDSVVMVKDGNLENLRVGNICWSTRSSILRNGFIRPTLIAKGMLHHNAKLTDDIVLDMRHRFDDGEEIVNLAYEYGLGRHAVRKAILALSWKHVSYRVRRKIDNHRAITTKLSEADIITIKNRINDGDSYQQVADDYGVVKTTIRNVYNGVSWNDH